MRRPEVLGERPLCLPLPNPHHVSEVGAEGACGLVVLHDAAVVQDLTAALAAKREERRVTEGAKV